MASRWGGHDQHGNVVAAQERRDVGGSRIDDGTRPQRRHRAIETLAVGVADHDLDAGIGGDDLTGDTRPDRTHTQDGHPAADPVSRR
jgi:hypothetical protein